MSCGSPPCARSTSVRSARASASVDCWHRGLPAGGVAGYTREDAWHDYRLSAIMAMLNPVLYHYIYESGGARGAALAAAMTTRLFSDLIECDAEAVIP